MRPEYHFIYRSDSEHESEYVSVTIRAKNDIDIHFEIAGYINEFRIRRNQPPLTYDEIHVNVTHCSIVEEMK